MASKIKDASSNLFTLNQSLKFGENLKSDESSILENHDVDLYNDVDDNREELQRLIEEVEAYKKQVNQLKFKNKELKDNLQILELHHKKHEQKQRELIKKLSHEQISNKQLQFEIKKANEQIIRIKQNARFSDDKNIQASNSLKKSQQQRSIFILSLKKIAQAISKCQRVEEFQSSMSKFLEFIKKNIKIYETSDPNGDFQFDLKFQLGQMGPLKSKNGQLENKILKLKQDLEKEKLEKKKQGLIFNEKILKIKEQYDDLRARLNQIADRKNEAEVELNALKKTINEKNQLIQDLKYRIDSEKKAKESVASRKSRIRKRSYYISDGEREQGTQPLSEIQNQIEDLQRQLIQVIQDFQS